MQLDPTNQFIKAILENTNIKNKKILEIGCGSGRITKDLVKYAKSVTAIDPDEKSLKQAKENIKTNNITFIKGSGEDLSFLTLEKFDVVLYSLSLHHIPYQEMKSSLVQATQLLSNSGEIIVIEPDKKGSLIEVEEKFNVGDGDETFVKEKAKEAVKSLQDWEIVKKSYFSTLFYFDNERDFFNNMVLDYNVRLASNIARINFFLKEHKKEEKIILSADRNISILKKKCLA